MKTRFSLVIFEENGQRAYIPQDAQSLLKEFANVVPEEIPPGLPPMRDIQHCIDFIHGATIPKKQLIG